MGLLDFEKYAPERRTSGDPHGVKLRAAVRDAARGQCPLCAVLDDQERARVHWLAYEGLSDVGLRKRLKHAKGLCRWHFRMLYGVVTEQNLQRERRGRRDEGLAEGGPGSACSGR